MIGGVSGEINWEMVSILGVGIEYFFVNFFVWILPMNLYFI
jgi:hypothetical protein